MRDSRTLLKTIEANSLSVGLQNRVSHRRKPKSERHKVDRPLTLQAWGLKTILERHETAFHRRKLLGLELSATWLYQSLASSTLLEPILCQKSGLPGTVCFISSDMSKIFNYSYENSGWTSTVLRSPFSTTKRQISAKRNVDQYPRNRPISGPKQNNRCASAEQVLGGTSNRSPRTRNSRLQPANIEILTRTRAIKMCY